MRTVLPAILLLTIVHPLARAEDVRPRPLMRDFIGLNVEAVQFKPELYAPVTRILRNRHPVKWDLGDAPSVIPPFPKAKNGLDWQRLYGAWKRAGYRTHAMLSFDDLAPGSWKDMDRDARAYGESVAKFFGPSAKDAMLEAVEIGMEPRKYDGMAYRRLFESMAGGVRAADPAMKIVMRAANFAPGVSGSGSVESPGSLWDILGVDCHAGKDSTPHRNWPENPATGLLEKVSNAVKWRDGHAPGKELWVTEFGCGRGGRSGNVGGNSSRRQGVTGEQQAMWSVRSFLVLARLGVDRAYLCPFDDCGEARLKGDGGSARDFGSSPAFHALAWLQRSLGEYRFSRVEREDPGECYVYEFTHGTDARKHVWAVWKPEGESRAVRVFNDPWRAVRAERMPLGAGGVEKVPVTQEIEGYLRVGAGERPVMIWLENP